MRAGVRALTVIVLGVRRRAPEVARRSGTPAGTFAGPRRPWIGSACLSQRQTRRIIRTRAAGRVQWNGRRVLVMAWRIGASARPVAILTAALIGDLPPDLREARCWTRTRIGCCTGVAGRAVQLPFGCTCADA